MTQYARPNSDVETSGWASTPLYAKIDEDIRNDSDYVESNQLKTTCRLIEGELDCTPNGPFDFEVKLSSITDPETSSDHIVKYAIGKDSAGGSSITIKVKLLQGATTIAQWTHINIGSGFTEFSQTLSTAEANSITDYSNLRLYFEASHPVQASTTNGRRGRVSWAELSTPDAASGGGEGGGGGSGGGQTFDPVKFPYKGQKELVYQLTKKAFIPYRYSFLSANSPFIVSAFTTPQLNTLSGVEYPSATLKYLVYIPHTTTPTFTIGYHRDNTFVDWISEDTVGVDAPGFLVGGYLTAQDTQREKGVTYLTVHCRRTETGFTDLGSGNFEAINPSSCLTQSQWEWTNSASSNRWSSTFEAYRIPQVYIVEDANDTFDTGYSIISTRNKIRGQGRAVTFKFSTAPGKDLHLLGYSLEVTGETKV